MLEELTKLIENPERLRLINKYGANNAIKFACISEEQETLEYLLTKEAITNKLTIKGIKEAFCFACAQNKQEIVFILITFITKKPGFLEKNGHITDTALFTACSKGYYQTVYMLMKNKSIQDSLSKDGIIRAKEITKLIYNKTKRDYIKTKKDKNSRPALILKLKTQMENLKKILKLF